MRLQRCMILGRSCLLITMVAFLASCGANKDGPPRFARNVHRIPDAVPRVEAMSKIGNRPYTVFGKRYFPMKSARSHVEKGIASWYGTKFHGRKTSNGETYDLYAMTAAHKTLPLPSYVRVTHLKTGKKIIVRVNDRGPFHGDRIIDLSYAAAKKLGIDGTGRVKIEVIDPKHYKKVKKKKKAKKRAPSSMPSLASYYVQAGAFKSQANAKSLAQALEAHGSGSVRIKKGEELHLVLVGPLPNRKAAEELLGTVITQGHRQAHIVAQ